MMDKISIVDRSAS